MGFISTFVKTVTDIVESGVANNASALAKAVSPLIFACVALYLVFLAYKYVVTNRDGEMLTEALKTITALTIVGVFTYSSDYYSTYVIPFVLKSGQEISAAMLGVQDTPSSVDAMWVTISGTMEAFLNDTLPQMGTWDIAEKFFVYAIYGIGYVGGLILVYYATIFICISTFMIGIALSAGVLFISFSLFPSTRGMFSAWCGSCLNYILLNVFYTISFSFLISFIETKIPKSAADMSISTVSMLLLTIVISIYLIEQIGTLCSTLTGGVGINGLVSAANGFGGGIAGGLASASGMRAFAGGFSGRMARPAAAAGRGAASNLIRSVTRGNKLGG